MKPPAASLGRRGDEARARQRGRELRALLLEWDPIGVGPEGPRDEYDCLLWPVLRKLEDRIGPAELSAFLARELQDHFGLQAHEPDIEAFVGRARTWFETRAGRAGRA